MELVPVPPSDEAFAAEEKAAQVGRYPFGCELRSAACRPVCLGSLACAWQLLDLAQETSNVRHLPLQRESPPLSQAS